MQRAIFVAAVVSGLMISVRPATAQPAPDAGVPDTGVADAAPSNAATPDAVKVDRVPVDVAPVVTAALKGDPVVAVHGPLSVDAGDVSAKPSLSPGRITGEVFGGFGLGIVGVLVGGGVGLITSNHRGDGASDINGIFFGGLVGYVIAVPLGVYLAGRVAIRPVQELARWSAASSASSQVCCWQRVSQVAREGTQKGRLISKLDSSSPVRSLDR